MIERDRPIRVAFLGAGRMGATHVRNLSTITGVEVAVIADRNQDAARAAQAVARAGRITTDVREALGAGDVDAVVIATPTGTHAELIEAAARAGKPVFCEKPIALDMASTRRVVETVRASGVPVQLGFMRRYDPGYADAKRRIDAGEIGRVERFRALSCDFTPPPLSFIKTSGGIFVDMLVHDVDVARLLVGEIAEVTAWGAALIDPGYTEAGDVDSAVAMLRFVNGALGTIEGARRTTWGYDIRTEVAGSAGKLVVEAPQKTPLTLSRDLGYAGDHYRSFPDRFEVAYRRELEAFFDALRAGRAPSPGPEDALRTLEVAIAATASLREGRPVRVGAAT